MEKLTASLQTLPDSARTNTLQMAAARGPRARICSTGTCLLPVIASHEQLAQLVMAERRYRAVPNNFAQAEHHGTLGGFHGLAGVLLH